MLRGQLSVRSELSLYAIVFFVLYINAMLQSNQATQRKRNRKKTLNQLNCCNTLYFLQHNKTKMKIIITTSLSEHKFQFKA